VEGHGPTGDIKAQGFRIIDKGAIVIFTGQSDLILKGAKAGAAPKAQPPAVPAPIAQAAALIETKVAPAANSPRTTPAAHSRPAPDPAATAPAHPKPAPKKPS
jgi:hypothetical protein